jgi:DUF2948 family protein
MEDLKLVALDKDDIEIVSAHVQDALVKIADIWWQPHDHRFVMALNRFDWMNAADAQGAKSGSPDDVVVDSRRRRTALRFERVNACKCRGLDQSDRNVVLNLLAVEFVERDSPAGTLTLTFSGGGAIRLEVECLEAELVDLGEVFTAARCPDHFAVDSTTA